MDEKWRLPLWAAAAKDMEFAATKRSEIFLPKKANPSSASYGRTYLTVLPFFVPCGTAGPVVS